jgi:hypothetical protein
LSTLPDVVYPLRRGNHNDELRYSLRSLVNVPHGKVVLSGYIPNWITGFEDGSVLGIAYDPPGSNWARARANIAVALDYVSDPFYLFNDDFYVMQPVSEIPVYHAGPLNEVIERYRRKRHTGAYWRGMQATYLMLQEWGISEPLGYELHLPMLMHKAPLQEALIRGQGIEALALRTAYGNLAGVGGIEREDCKVIAHAGVQGWEQWPYLSSNDDLSYSPLGKHLARTFPHASTYESDAYKEATVGTATGIGIGT